MSGYNEKTDSEISDEFSKLCLEVRRQVGKELLELTKRHVKSEDALIEAISFDEPMYDDVDIIKYLGEFGCPICRKDDRVFLGTPSEPATGAGCRIREASCERMGGEYIGSFHTHPIGGNTPSVADIECGIRREEEIMCIGGTIGGDYRVACYSPRSKPRRIGLMYNPRGYYPDMSDIRPSGEIEFYREVPPPTAEDIVDAIGRNEDEIRSIIASYHMIETDDPDMPEMVADFLATLAEGEIPEEYSDVDIESEGEFDTLEIYLGDDLREIETRRRDILRRDLHMCEL